VSATGDAELGHKLRKRRLEGDHGLKQPAHFAGIKPSTLSDYEKGRSTPGVVVLKKLADFYGVRVDWLLSHLSWRDTAAYSIDHNH
jgi:transcriptional regulator with XRE-family HTH domain